MTDSTNDPTVLGHLTPEEHDALLQRRQQTQQLLVKIGEHDIMKARLRARVEELDVEGQEIISRIGARLNLPEGQTWEATHDGIIRIAAPKDG